MSAVVRTLSGTEKAAIFLMAMGEGAAAEVLKHIGPRGVQSIGAAMAQLENVSRDMVRQTVDEFIADTNTTTNLGIGSDDYIRKVLVDAFGQEKGSTMCERILSGGISKGFDSLKWMDPRSIVEMIQFEHPQIIAIVLAFLDSDQAAEVLGLMPENKQYDILMRIASMDGVQPAAMNELNELLELHSREGTVGQAARLGGVKCAAGILNFVDRAVEASISEKITEIDPEMAEQIRDLMFTFDDLAAVDDRSIQALLREVSTENLVLALKGTDDPIQNKVFSNMSERAREMLKDDIEAKGPVRVSEVEAAQKEILGIARRLADEGQMNLGGSGGEEMMA